MCVPWFCGMWGGWRMVFFSTKNAHKPAVVCLQETHLQANSISTPQLPNPVPLHSHSFLKWGQRAHFPCCLLSFTALPDWWAGKALFFTMQIARITMYYCKYICPSILLIWQPGMSSTIYRLILSDYNNVLDKQMDPELVVILSRVVPPPLLASLQNLVWEMCGGTKNLMCFSCYSASYKCLSRIDLCLGNTLAHQMTDVRPMETSRITLLVFK